MTSRLEYNSAGTDVDEITANRYSSVLNEIEILYSTAIAIAGVYNGCARNPEQLEIDCDEADQEQRKKSIDSYEDETKVLLAQTLRVAYQGHRTAWLEFQQRVADLETLCSEQELLLVNIQAQAARRMGDTASGQEISASCLTAPLTSLGDVSKACWFLLCSDASVGYAEASEAQGDPPCPVLIRPNSAACSPA